MLGTEVFGIDELTTIARTARERLLRHKWGMAFGIAVRDTGRCVYLNREDYHEGVVWPRDTPYLIRLLSIAGGNGARGSAFSIRPAPSDEGGLRVLQPGAFQLRPRLDSGKRPGTVVVPVGGPLPGVMSPKTAMEQKRNKSRHVYISVRCSEMYHHTACLTLKCLYTLRRFNHSSCKSLYL